MSTEKQRIYDNVAKRRKSAKEALEPQWRACKKTRPRGHIYDGTKGRGYWMPVCLYCGKPDYFNLDVLTLEACLAEAHLYPIANGEEKGLSFA